jgi:hypothetical protein
VDANNPIREIGLWICVLFFVVDVVVAKKVIAVVAVVALVVVAVVAVSVQPPPRDYEPLTASSFFTPTHSRGDIFFLFDPNTQQRGHFRVSGVLSWARHEAQNTCEHVESSEGWCFTRAHTAYKEISR